MILPKHSIQLVACIFILTLSNYQGKARNKTSLDFVRKVRPSLYKIYTTSQGVDYRHPWKFSPLKRSTGTGFYIGKNLIMTNAHVVTNAKSIFVQRDKKAHLERAYVEFIAHDSDLAVLSVLDKKYFENVRALKFQEGFKLNTVSHTIGFPRGGEQLSVTKGIISRVAYNTYVHSGMSKHTLLQVDSAINPGNSGGPVFHKEKVIGVAFQSKHDGQNIGYMIPPHVVNRFLEDIKDGYYDTHPTTGLFINKWTLGNKAVREYYGQTTVEGVEVTFVEKNSSAHIHIQEGDILLKIDEYPIGVDGKIYFLNERVDFRAIFDLKQIGQSINFVILRNKQKKKVSVELKPYTSHFSSFKNKRQGRFVHYGGIVFTPLTTDWLRMAGDNWKKKINPFLNYLFYYSKFDPSFSHIEEFVIVSELLPHPANSPYRKFKHAVVESLNDKKVTSFSHFYQLVDQKTNNFSKIKFFNRKESLIINLPTLKKLTKEITKLYGLKKARVLTNNLDGSVVKGDLK